MSSWGIFIWVWFTLVFIIQWTTSVILWFWLRQRDVKLTWALGGMPGYLECAYREWCLSNDRSSRIVVTVQNILWINLFVAGIACTLVVS